MEQPVSLRLARMGIRHRPFYRIVAAHKEFQRDGRFLERLGTYDPLPREGVKHVTIDLERTKYWLSVGANPTEPVAKLLAKIREPRPEPVPGPGHDNDHEGNPMSECDEDGDDDEDNVDVEEAE
eukprot:gene19953-23366_t